MKKETVIVKDWGKISYSEAWIQQEELLKEDVDLKMAGRSDETKHYFIFCEHPPVFTLGKAGTIDHLLVSDQLLKEKQIEFVKTNRGGDITFHGPEQVVGYPILDLEKFFKDLGKFVRNLEEIIILTLAEYGIDAGRSPGETGVWLDPKVKSKARKICAIGTRFKRWTTMHGFALNVNTDLSYFDMIVPCGIRDKKVASMQNELGHPVDPEEVKEKILTHFEAVFNADLQLPDLKPLVEIHHQL